MKSLFNRSFRDANEEEFYNERLALLIIDDRLDDVEAEKCAWVAVLKRRERNE